MELIQLRLLGFPEFRLDGRPIQLALRKAAALVIYLAEAGGPVARNSRAASRQRVLVRPATSVQSRF